MKYKKGVKTPDAELRHVIAYPANFTMKGRACLQAIRHIANGEVKGRRFLSSNLRN
jgi:hypothetical protein